MPSIRAAQIIAWAKQFRPNPGIGAEIGVNTGTTSAALLEAFPQMHLIMVDPWAPPRPGNSYYRSGDRMSEQDQDWHDGCKAEAMQHTNRYSERRSVYEVGSLEAAQFISPKTLDLIFIDGDHSYEGVVADIQAWWPKMTEGSVFSGHDYNRPAVKRAVDEFADAWELEVTEGDHATWMVITPPPRAYGDPLNAEWRIGEERPGLWRKT